MKNTVYQNSGDPQFVIKHEDKKVFVNTWVSNEVMDKAVKYADYLGYDLIICFPN